jgi:copper chaperone CopZ
MTLASAGVCIATVRTVEASEKKTVTYRVKGFSCVTCAVGLDAMLRGHEGVIQSRSSYPNETTVVEFNPNVVTEKSLKEFIAELGFIAEEEHKRNE